MTQRREVWKTSSKGTWTYVNEVEDAAEKTVRHAVVTAAMTMTAPAQMI